MVDEYNYLLNCYGEVLLKDMDENLNLEGNTEIEKALKEFEEKSQVEQVQKTFEVSKTSDVPKMVQLVMKWSGVKEQKQAEYVLLGFVIIAVIISLFLVFGGSSPSKAIPSIPNAGVGDLNFRP